MQYLMHPPGLEASAKKLLSVRRGLPVVRLRLRRIEHYHALKERF
jgi:hypothetical protein